MTATTPCQHAILFLLLILVETPLAAQRGDVVQVCEPAIIEEGGIYYLFSAGEGIPVRTSSDLKTWTLSGRVFEANTNYP
jgi:hypothetical protein